jgi:YbbR domain-containing protein
MKIRLLDNFWTKLLSLFLAVAVWFVVSAPRRERTVERAYAAPLALIGVPRDLVITTAVQDTVNVRLRGRLSSIRSISSANLEATVDLSTSQPGEFVVTLRQQALNVPQGVEVVSIEPNKIRFRLERLRQKVVPVRAFLAGAPPAGYMPGDPTVVPAEALVSGPASQIRDVTEVATERIIMTGRTATFVQNVAVVSDTTLVRVIEPLTAQVTVPVIATTVLDPALETTATAGPPATTTPPAKQDDSAKSVKSHRKDP